MSEKVRIEVDIKKHNLDKLWIFNVPTKTFNKLKNVGELTENKSIHVGNIIFFKED